MDWDNLKFFLAVARTQNVSDASIKLKVSASTVARKINDLEYSLGTTLFNKKTNGYYLTEVGENILPVAEETAARLEFMARQIGRQASEKSGVIRLDMPELIGLYFITPILRNIQEEYPDISFEFTNSVVTRKLTNAQSDVIIRLHKPDSGLYTMRKIGVLQQAAYCSSEYALKNGVPQSAEDLGGHFLIGWNEDLSYQPLAQWFARATNGMEPWMRSANLYAQLNAVDSGLGIAALPSFAARRLGLQRVLEATPPLEVEIWLLRNMETRSYKSIDLVVESITGALDEHRELLLA